MEKVEEKHRCNEQKMPVLEIGMHEKFEKIVSDSSNNYTYSDILKMLDFYLLHPLHENKYAQAILRDRYHWRIKSKDKSGSEIWKLSPDKLFQSMLEISGLKDNIYFNYTEKQTKKALQAMDLDNSHICPLHVRAVLNMDCKKKIVEDDEGNLSVQISDHEAGYRCLFRHIRNALAHNNVSFFENGNILLKDYQRDGEKQKGNKVTAAILIKFDTLFDWIKIIEVDQDTVQIETNE